MLDTLLQSAVRLCSADQGTVAQRKGDTFYRSVSYGFSPVYLDYVKDIPVKPGRDTGTGRALLEGKVIHIPDVLADPDFTWKEGQRLGGFRTVLGVPMLREGVAVGVFALTRSAVRPFSDEQIALVENFAAQAVIAIENARLLNELRQRTDDLSHRTTDLTEALEQQTATSEVLQVISSSGDLQLVFQAMLENATRICEAKFGVVFRFDGNAFDVEAHVGTPPQLAEYINRTRPMPQPLPGSHLDRVKETKRVSYTADYAAERIPAPPVTLGGARSTVDVPMLKDGELVGAFSIFRQEVRPFTEKQIELLTNFAAQAVIAIENARLLNELRGALERQTATSEVLQVISSSPGDLKPVFAAMLEKAVRICDAKFGNIYRAEGDGLRNVVTHNTPTAFAEALRGSPYFSPAPNNPVRRMMTTKKLCTSSMSQRQRLTPNASR